MQKTNVSFFSYFKTLNQASNRDKLAKTLIIQMLYAAMFAIVTGILNNFGLIVILIGFMAFFAPIPLQWARTAKPNLASLVPLSQKRRTVYNILSIPAMFVFSLVISTAVVVSIWLISGLGAAAIIGDSGIILSVFRTYTEGLVSTFADGYAALLFVSLLLFDMGAGMIYTNIDGKKLRNIITIALFVVSLTGAEVLLQISMKYAITTAALRPVHVAGYAGMYIKFMPLPWLAVLLCALAGLSVFAAGIYLLIQKNKPKNY